MQTINGHTYNDKPDRIIQGKYGKVEVYYQICSDEEKKKNDEMVRHAADAVFRSAEKNIRKMLADEMAQESG